MAELQQFKDTEHNVRILRRKEFQLYMKKFSVVLIPKIHSIHQYEVIKEIVYYDPSLKEFSDDIKN